MSKKDAADSRLDPKDRQRLLFRKLQIRKWSRDTIEMVPDLVGAYQAYAGRLCATRTDDATETTATVRRDRETSLEGAARLVVQELFACRCFLTKQTRQIRSTQESIQDGGVSAMSVNEIQDVLHSNFAREFLSCPGVAEAIGPLYPLLLDPATRPCEKTGPMKQESANDLFPATERAPDAGSPETKPFLVKRDVPTPSQRFTVLGRASRSSRKQQQAAVPVDPMAVRQERRWWASSQRLCAERMRPHSERLRRQLVERMAEQAEARRRLAATRKNALQQNLLQLLEQTNPFANVQSPIRPAANTVATKHKRPSTGAAASVRRVCHACRARYAAETRRTGWPAGERMPLLCRSCRHRQPVARPSTTAVGSEHSRDSTPDANDKVPPSRLRLRPGTMSVASCFRVAKKQLPSAAALQTSLAVLLRAAKGPLSASMTRAAAALGQQIQGLLQNVSGGSIHDGPAARLAAAAAAANKIGPVLPRTSESESCQTSRREEKIAQRQKSVPGYVVNDPRLFFGHYY